MKELNPHKKAYYVCDSMQSVTEKAAYLRMQTELSIGEFYDETKPVDEIQLKCDILVFTVDFLEVAFYNYILCIGDCSVLIMDEINYSVNEKKFSNLLEDSLYFETGANFKPRLVGCKFYKTS